MRVAALLPFPVLEKAAVLTREWPAIALEVAAVREPVAAAREVWAAASREWIVAEERAAAYAAASARMGSAGGSSELDESETSIASSSEESVSPTTMAR